MYFLFDKYQADNPHMTCVSNDNNTDNSDNDIFIMQVIEYIN